MSVGLGFDRTVRGQVLYHWPPGACEEELRLAAAPSLEREHFDVAILGAGVVGTALAYRLSQEGLRLIVLEERHDVGEGTSKANSAIIHTGFDATPGSLEATLVTRASRQWPELARRLRIPFQPVSAVLVATEREQQEQLPTLEAKARKNGVDDVAVLSAAEVRSLAPHTSPVALGGLHVPRESIVDPFMASIAYAEVAVVNGAVMVFGFRVADVTTEGRLHVIRSDDGHRVRARWIINAAALGSMAIARRYGGRQFDLNPRRGQFLLFDKVAARWVERILLPVPTAQTKGVLVAPTIFGNVLAGPTAEDLPPDQVHAVETTPRGLEEVRRGMVKLCPALAGEPVIATFAGLRCNCRQGSYQIVLNDGQPGIVTICGVRSTGLTASISLAEYVLEQMQSHCGLPRGSDPQAVDGRPADAWPGWASPRPFDEPARLAARPDYARMVCYCELVSRQELLDAIHSPLRPRTLDALRRRTRAATGRCQGFNCLIPIAELLSESTGIPLERVTKKGPGSEIFQP